MLKDKPEKEIAATNDNSFIYKDIEERMKAIFGSKVEIRRGTNNKGKIEIEYYSQDDFERILDLINTLAQKNKYQEIREIIKQSKKVEEGKKETGTI